MCAGEKGICEVFKLWGKGGACRMCMRECTPVCVRGEGMGRCDA